MRLMSPSRPQPSRLVAAALTLLTGLALAAPGHACDKDKSASASTASTVSTASSAGVSSCPAMARCPMSGATGATAVTADLKAAHSSSGCCGMSKSTAACPHDAATATRRSSATARTASMKGKAALKAKAKVKAKAEPAAGATAAAVTPGTAGMVAVIDPVTGGVVAATKEQLAAFAASSKSAGGVTTMAARPVDPEIVQLPDGTLMARLPERLTMNAVAHRDANGKVTFTCGNDPALTAPAPATEAPSTWEVK